MNRLKLLCVVLVIIFVLSGCTTKLNETINKDDVVVAGSTANDLSSAEYKLFAENEKFSFWFNENTTAFKVIDKLDGFEWYSTDNPTQSKNAADAPFTLSYVNQSGLIEKMDAMTACISDGQYVVQKTDKGATVTYSLGEYDSELIVPLAISKERKDFILSKVENDFEKNQIEIMYQYVELEKLNEENQKKFSELYPKLLEGPLYILRENVMASNTKMKDLALKLNKLGYTEEMYREDSVNFITEDKGDEVKPCFRVQIIYELSDKGLKVTLPSKEIQMNSELPLLEIELLKYFGSPNVSDEGYFLLPDGSGSLMNFYNGAGNLQEYSVDIYGLDYSAAQTENIYQCDQAYFPVYGIKNGSHAAFAVIEGCDAVATVIAYPGGDQLSPYAYPKFRLRSYTKSYTNNNNSNTQTNYFISLQNKRTEDDIVVNYNLLNGEDSTYKGMAKFYRNYLFGDAKNSNAAEMSGLLVECIGQINKDGSIAGFKYSEDIVLTDYNDVKNIAEELNEKGLKNLKIKLNGWYNGAVRNAYSGKLNLNKKLGNANELKELYNYLKDKGIGLYPEADMLYTYETAAFDGFSSNQDTVTLVSKAKGYRIEYNPATFNRDPKYITPYYINNKNAIVSAFDGFFKSYDKLGLESVSLRNIGRDLNGDYDDNAGEDREQILKAIDEKLAAVAESKSVITNGINAYVLDNIDYCSDIPLTSNGRVNTDESIPFVQMVVSGNIAYSGPAINLSGDTKKCILKMAAVAADPYYVVSAKNSNETRDTDYAYLFNSDYEYLKNDITGIVKKYCDDMSGLSGKQITDYEKLSKNLYKTTFEGGATVIVNYSERNIEFDGVVYEANSYVVNRQEG